METKKRPAGRGKAKADPVVEEDVDMEPEEVGADITCNIYICYIYVACYIYVICHVFMSNYISFVIYIYITYDILCVVIRGCCIFD